MSKEEKTGDAVGAKTPGKLTSGSEMPHGMNVSRPGKKGDRGADDHDASPGAHSEAEEIIPPPGEPSL